jgi:hypothetical protein
MTSLTIARLRALEQPSHIDRLLRSLVRNMSVVPDDADAVHEPGELPAPWLRDIVVAAACAGDSWRCWMDGRLRLWLFVAKLSVPLSRAAGLPVLHVEFFRESGLSESADWAIDRQSRWHRCSISSPSHESVADELTLTSIDFYRPDIAEG